MPSLMPNRSPVSQLQALQAHSALRVQRLALPFTQFRYASAHRVVFLEADFSALKDALKAPSAAGRKKERFWKRLLRP